MCFKPQWLPRSASAYVEAPGICLSDHWVVPQKCQKWCPTKQKAPDLVGVTIHSLSLSLSVVFYGAIRTKKKKKKRLGRSGQVHTWQKRLAFQVTNGDLLKGVWNKNGIRQNYILGHNLRDFICSSSLMQSLQHSVAPRYSSLLSACLAPGKLNVGSTLRANVFYPILPWWQLNHVEELQLSPTDFCPWFSGEPQLAINGSALQTAKCPNQRCRYCPSQCLSWPCLSIPWKAAVRFDMHQS